MKTIALEVETRENPSRTELKALRKSGWVPAVLYGGEAAEPKGKSKAKAKGGSVLLKVNEKNFLKTLGPHHGSNVLIELKFGGQAVNTVLKEIQRDVLTDHLLNIDFQRILMTEKLEVMVPIHLEGEAPGVKLNGGILEQITRELKISCLPKDMPSVITVDVSKLDIGQGITIGDIKAVPGVEILSDPHQLVANVVAPTILEEVPVAAPAGPAEPEVIAKGKKPEEGEEGAAPAKGAAAPAAGKPAEKGAAAPAKPAAPTGK